MAQGTMATSRVARRISELVVQRLFLVLGGMLGVCQALVVHWALVVSGRGAGAGLGLLLVLGVGFTVANAILLPRLRAGRRLGGLRGTLARGYLQLGVGTLLVGLVVAVGWLALPVFVSLVEAVGARAELAYDVYQGASLLAVGSAAGVVLWGFTLGQMLVDRTDVAVEIPGLDPALDGFRIAHVSDLHIGNALDGARLRRLVARTNAACADAIVVTGDLFDFDRKPVEEGARQLAGLRAPCGVYAILGNHDHHYVGADYVASELARHAPELRLLRNEIVALPVEAPLYLAGADEDERNWAARDIRLDCVEELAARRPDDGPTLLLVHRPEVFGQARELGFPLVLAGHTHGGQLALPLQDGRHNLARLFYRYARGLYREGTTSMYVNRGLGVGGPAIRLNCRREIAVVELRAAAPV